MNKNKRWKALACTLALTALCGGVAMAAVGDQNDPLVTKSYVEQMVIPQVVKEVEGKLATQQEAFSKKLSDQIAQYKLDIAAVVGTTNSGSASYTLVTLVTGQSLSLDVGCEVMLRVGTATVKAATSPALIDVSTGGTVDSGTALVKNHLYMATIADRSITLTAATVKLLVRGGYRVV